MSRLAFSDPARYQPSPAYQLLPFRFMRLDSATVLMTNDVGDHLILPRGEFDALVAHTLDTRSDRYHDLRAKNFVADDYGSVHARVLASRYRTKKAFLDGFAKLHIFVATLRCDHSCPYCQVSRQSEDRLKYDMTPEMARKGVDLMLRVPAPAVTCEFQGGEALLNFPLVQETIEYAVEQNQTMGKRIDFVVCTNLSTLSDEHLAYFARRNVKVSTSLDGPAFLHDRNRPFTKGSSHAVVERNIRRAQEALGLSQVSALMTATRESLKHPQAIVDEYLRLNLGSIFLRSLSPYGFAVKTQKSIGYTADEFLAFYKAALSHIIAVNRGGRTFSEAYASIILQKILTPFPVGYVDLQSPAGAGFGAVVYNYDGEVYASDEARMLAEMNDTSFRLGSLLENSYEEIFFGQRMQEIAAASCNEALAGCSDCAFQPYCGADPVFHYATQADMFGNRASSDFCRKNMGIMRHLFGLLGSGDSEIQEIFAAWISESSLTEARLPPAPWL